MLLKQSPTEIDLIAKTFYLSEGEKELLLSSDVGEGLFFAGQSHVVMKVIAAPFEHSIITSNPQELAKQQDQASAEVTPQNNSPIDPMSTVEKNPLENPPIEPPSPPVFNKS